MHQTLISRWGLSIWRPFVFIFLSLCALRAEVVYDNTQTFGGTFYPSVQEFGDEIYLGGQARTITDFSLDYYGEFTPAAPGAQTAVVRFYLNDGPAAKAGQYPPPGTMLYQSSPILISPGYNALSLRGLSVKATNQITWTIQFYGFGNTTTYSNRAGVLFYDPAEVGFSYDDFWQNVPGRGWIGMRFNGSPKANFSARILAGPEPAAEVVSATLENKGVKLTVQGPLYQGAQLEAKNGDQSWKPVTALLFTQSKMEVWDLSGQTNPLPQYRLQLSTNPVIAMTAGRKLTNGSQTLSIRGTPGQSLLLETSTDMKQWFPNQSNYLTSVRWEVVDAQAPGFGRRFYRVVGSPDDVIYLSSITPLSPLENLLLLAGPPGRDCVILASTNLVSWQPASTNTFSYSGGAIYFRGQVTTPATYYQAQIRPAYYSAAGEGSVPPKSGDLVESAAAEAARKAGGDSLLLIDPDRPDTRAGEGSAPLGSREIMESKTAEVSRKAGGESLLLSSPGQP